MVVTLRRRIINATIEFDADCPSIATVEDLVYVIGPASVGILQVDIVDVTDRNKMPAIGIIISKTTDTRCRIKMFGEVTSTTLLSPGERYFVGVNSKPSLTQPSPTLGGEAFFQPIGYAVDTNKLIFNPELTPIIRRG